MLSNRFEEALVFAHRLHIGQTRKGSDVPYITHLMNVASLVGEFGGDEDAMIAALLHDAIEDQGGQQTREQIAERFGEQIAAWVEDCSDTNEVPKPPWRARKEAFIARIASLDPSVRLVVAADKLHNAQTVARGHAVEGDAVWERFKGAREGSLWYYRAALEALKADWDHPILAALEEAVDRLHELSDPVS